MNFWQLIALALTGMTVSLLLKHTEPSFAVYSSLAAAIALIAAALVYIKPAVDFAMELSSSSGTGNTLSVIMKITAMAAVTSLAADICDDAGERAIASGVKLLGKCAIALTVLPVLRLIITSVREFLT